MVFKILNEPMITGFTCIEFPAKNCINQKNLIPVTKERSLAIAEDFLRECSTFKYDGIHDSVRLSIIDVLPQLHCWRFTFVFSCRHSGYGNRQGQRLLQMQERHRICITVENGIITDAVIDNVWNEMQQRSL
jgi:hypothetical protein